MGGETNTYVVFQMVMSAVEKRIIKDRGGSRARYIRMYRFPVLCRGFK